MTPIFALLTVVALTAQETEEPVHGLPPSSPQHTSEPTPATLEPDHSDETEEKPIVTTGRGNLDAPPKPPTGPARPEVVPAGEDDIQFDSADTLRGDEATDKLYAEGNVALRWKGYRVTSDRATYDRKNRYVTFESRVTLETGRQTVYADYVGINLKTREFDARNARTIVPPDLAGGNLIQPLYLSGASIGRIGKDIVATEGFLTTCDFPFPHYRIGFRHMKLIPNKRIILRDTTIYHYDTVILRIPYLVIPIQERINYQYLPLVGHNEEEGYFIKNAIGYTLGDNFPGIARLDYMSKKGVGYGFEQGYKFAEAAAGTLLIYTLRDRSRNTNNLNGRLNHTQRIGEIDLSVLSDFQNNSYYAANQNSKTQTTTLTANRNIGPSSTTVTYTLGNSDFSGSVNKTSAYSITQNQRVGQNFNVSVRINGTSQNNVSGTGDTRTETSRRDQYGDLSANGRLGIFDVTFNANKTLAARQTGVAGSTNFFSGTERQPQLTLRTTADRIGGSFTGLPAMFSLDLGRFVENPGPTTTSRALFTTDLNPRPYWLTPKGWLAFTFNGGFRQYLYDDTDAAQYVLNTNSQLTQRLATRSTFNLTYSYLRSYGGAPLDFRLDTLGSNNNLGANLSVDGAHTRLSLLTGYDIQRATSDLPSGVQKNPWQNLTAQLSFRPNNIFQTRFTATYDINNEHMIDSTNKIRVRTPGGFALDTGIRYDPVQKKYPQINGALESPLLRGSVYLKALVGYNGVTKQFNYKSFALTRVLHDYELTLNYIEQPFGFRAEKGFSLSIRLKAFPAAFSSSTGQYGTPLDTGTGEVF